jgi:putative transposase
MRQAGIAGIRRHRRGGCTRRDLDAQPSDDLVQRAFDPIEPDRLWVMDVTEHPTENGKAYLAVVLDAFSRRVVGRSDDRPQRPRVHLHLVGLRQAPARCRAARLHGIDR